MVWLFGLLFCLGHTKAHLWDTIEKRDLIAEDQYLSLLIKLQKEEFYDTLLIYGEDCVFLPLAKRLDVSTVLVKSGSTDYDWDFGSLTLILSCGFKAEKEENYRTQMKLQKNRRLIYLDEDVPPETICRSYALKDQYNIAMVKPDFYRSKGIFACRYFQDPNYEEVKVLDDQPIFINQFLNMHGAPIRTLPDSLAPRTMVYTDPKTAETKVIGYVANMVNCFAEKINATMVIQEELQNLEGTIYYGNISKWAGEDLLDIGMSLDSTWDKVNFDTYTYPYVTCTYCFMIPMPKKMPYNEIYSKIVDFPVVAIMFMLLFLLSLLWIYSQRMSWRGLSLADVLLNDSCVRGLLGQAFPFPTHSSKKLKLICFLLCFAGVMTTNMYEAFLQSFLTSPPPEPMIQTFGDVHRSRYKVAMSSAEMDILKHVAGPQMRMLKSRVQVFEIYNTFISMRESFNASYIYPVTDVRWSTYREQQKLFAKPVFYYSDAFCLNRFTFLIIPLRRRLPYRDLLEEHMLRQKEFGLLRYWIDRSFYDMVMLGITPVADLSLADGEQADEPIYLSDLKWVFVLYGVATMLSCLCFALERWGSLVSWRRLTSCIPKFKIY
ncbi:hypothetical protein KR009_008436 [Drosophila setifemur]|nr:hypothetical protein KR009_008436 [Drosophila setifemur]